MKRRLRPALRYVLLALLGSSAWALNIEYTGTTSIAVVRDCTYTSPAYFWRTTGETPDSVAAEWVGTVPTGAVAPTLGSDDRILSFSIPAGATPNTYQIRLKAIRGGVTVTSPSNLFVRVNKPPAGPASIAISRAEDSSTAVPAQTSVLAEDDDRDHPLLDCQVRNLVSQGAISSLTASASLVAIQTRVQLNLTLVPHASTAAPATATLRVTDSDGEYVDVPIAITVTPVNDPPVISLASGTPTGPLAFDPAAGVPTAVGDGLDLSEPLDHNATTFTSGANTFAWVVSVPGGVEGGDLLLPRAHGTGWTVVDGTIRNNGITVATWTRTASHALRISLVASQGQATALGALAQVHYAWLLGTPPAGSAYNTRSVRVEAVEPTGAGTQDISDPFTRQVAFQTPNTRPSCTLGIGAVPPLGSAALAIQLTDDDDSRATLTLTREPRAGRFEDAQGQAIGACSVAAVRAGQVRYRNTATDVREDSAVFLLSDNDPRGAKTSSAELDITLAMPRSAFSVLSDPLLEVGGDCDWPLRFSSTPSATPTLAAFPGLGAVPPGVSITGAAPDWTLHIDWTAAAGRGFLAFVVTANKDADRARQPMIVRLRPGARSSIAATAN